MDQKELTDKVAEVEKQSKEFLESAQAEALIKNNQIDFEHKGIKYRIKRPTFDQRQKSVSERSRKFIALLRDPAELLEKDMIALYAERGISVKEIDDKLKQLSEDLKDYQLKLGQAIVDNKEKADMDLFKRELEFIVSEQKRMIMERSVLLEACIETQIILFTYGYLGAMLTEKMVLDGEKETWTLVWDSYDAFKKESEELVNIILWNTSLISKSDGS